MSRQSKTEYIAQKRTKYDCAKSRRVKGRLIDEVVQTLDVSRKYAIRLLTGNRVYRPSKGRGATYSEATIKLMIELWHLVNEPNAKYFVAQMERFLNDLKALREVPQELAEGLLRMSASTIERKLRGEPRQPLGALRRSYRRKNTKSFEFVSIGSGEDIPAYHVEPGDIQVDTVALCGGDMRGNFIWILTMTDRRTQWTEIRAVWNRGAAGIFAAMDEMIRRFPFHVRSLHYDNGSEFMNDHLVRFAKEHPKIAFARSRTGCCNDNAHVEQKNSSLVRTLFGYRRFDNPDLLDAINRLCVQWSDYNNLCVATCMTISKVKRETKKGFTHHYDKPATPAERVLGHPELTVRHRKALLRRVRETNAISLFDKLRRSFARICSKLEDYRLAHQENAEAASAAAAAASDSAAAHPTEGAARPLRHPALLPPDTHYPTGQPPPSAPPSVSSK